MAKLRRLPMASVSEPTRLLEPRERDLRAKPVLAVWELTLRCDLACEHCGSRAGRARQHELDTAECLELAARLIEIGVREVSLIGGEAYLHPGWLEVIRFLASSGVQVAMVTGGYNFTSERARAAKAAGLSGISVSIDGIGATHDQLRGREGSFERALTALQVARDAGLVTSINSQFNRKNRDELEALARLVHELGVRSWQYSLTVAMGRAVDNWELLFQPYDLLEFLPRLAAVTDSIKSLGVRAYPGNNVGYFGPHEETFRGGMPRGHTQGCAAGHRALGIEADGTLKGCPSLDTRNYGAGSLREHSLEDLWQRSHVMQRTRDGAKLWGYCAECYYKSACGAGCTWTSSVLFGKPGNNPYCHHRAEQLAARGQMERLVRVAPAPGEPFDTGRFELELVALDPSVLPLRASA
jgi:radical SAM protein with 4Fe4S-binding SPASM domain